MQKKILPINLIALIILSLSVINFTANAQDKKKDEKSTVHIVIEKNENGKIVSIDTTVTKEQLPALKEYLKGKDVDLQTEEKDDHSSHVTVKTKTFSNEDREKFGEDKEKFREDMKQLHQDLAKMREEIKDIRIEINGDNEDDFDFNLSMPPMPPTPPSPGKHHKSYSYSYSYNDSDVPDSLNDDKHIVIRSKKGEGKPEFEKEITGKNGEHIFIYKRKLPKEDK